MARFVILTHDWPQPHWDFLVEFDGVLKAWRLQTEPVVGKDVPAEQNFDHRPFYLDFEGPVSSGRGCVSRWDAGPCDWCANEPDRAEIELRGTRLAGRATLRRTGEGWAFCLTAHGAG